MMHLNSTHQQLSWLRCIRSRFRLAVTFTVMWLACSAFHNQALALQARHSPAPRQSEPQLRKARSITNRGAQAAALLDCNLNGIPDEDDIENCIGDPACDDCNINGIPDSCDIAAGFSLDVNINGVPDECVKYDDGGVGNNWSTPTNWDDDEVPDNLDLVDDESVTIDANAVLLDLHIEVDTLRLFNGSFMSLTGTLNEDFEVEELGGILIMSNTSVQSRMLIGDGRRISVVPGTLHIRSGGVYEAALTPPNLPAGTAAPVISGKLEAGNIIIESRCGEPIPGEMTLSNTMKTEVFGNLIVDATQDCALCALCAPQNSSVSVSPMGGETPPILRVKGSAILKISNDFILAGPVAFSHTSSMPIEIGGNFVNQSTCPECVVITGKILLATQPTIPAGPAIPQFFEVAGQDLGPSASGLSANFATSTLEVGISTTVHFEDTFPNSGTGGPEALYVDTLILRNHSTVIVSNCHVYYNTLINEGATISTIGTGALVAITQTGPVPAVSAWGVVAMVLSIMLAGTLVMRRSALAIH